jgi:hypothetical protein
MWWSFHFVVVSNDWMSLRLVRTHHNHSYVRMYVCTHTPTCAWWPQACVCIHVHVHTHICTTCVPHALCTHKQCMPLTPLTFYVCVCVCVRVCILESGFCKLSYNACTCIHCLFPWYCNMLGGFPLVVWFYIESSWWCISVCGGVGSGGVMAVLVPFLFKHLQCYK